MSRSCGLRCGGGTRRACSGGVVGRWRRYAAAEATSPRAWRRYVGRCVPSRTTSCPWRSRRRKYTTAGGRLVAGEAEAIPVGGANADDTAEIPAVGAVEEAEAISHPGPDQIEQP